MKKEPDQSIVIFDTTLRDGEQAPGYSMTLDEKLRMARQLERLGVDIIEAGFAAASPGDFESVLKIASELKNCTVCSLSRALPKDIDAAAEALSRAANPRIHTFLATSDLHLKYKLRMTHDRALEQIRDMVAYARNKCTDVEFSAEDATRTNPDFLCRAIETAIASGATTVNLPDTVGYATSEEIARMVTDIRSRVPNIDKAVISMHVHNDLGLAVANTLAGIIAGARQVECTIGGIGERAGNAALEEIVMGLKTREDYYGLTNNVRTEEIARTARLLTSITGVKMFPSKAIVGANAFAHESGIHQHGVLKNAKTYEIMTPESVGVKKTDLVLGKHSGRHAFSERLKLLGFSLSEERIEELFLQFKHLADKKKTVTDRDITALAESEGMSESTNTPRYKLESFVVTSGNKMSATANVILTRGDQMFQDSAIATGPVYAAIRAVEKIIAHPFSLDDYHLNAVTEHRDALGEVTVKISDAYGSYRGRGVSTDVIEASILACLSAINKMLEGASLGSGAASKMQHSFENDMLSAGHTDKTNLNSKLPNSQL
ncbi:MAG: 2-isopropylmalate synthase [Kiritimatiellae bacterium]|nr:2-isopropylmalate synthase [Kiritimatiellia bacterium]